jgi:predicted dehydrogenase
MKPVRAGIIGCGKVGHIHAAALARSPLARFTAVCDTSEERARAFAAQYGAAAFTDPNAMLREVDALLLCTPHPLHAAHAVIAAEAGVHVLIEKPMAANVADCDAMIGAARKSGVKLSVISQRRWLEPVRRMKRAIDEGRIGRPILGTFVMLSWRDAAYYRSDPWRGRWDTEGGGVLVNQSPHQLDLLHWLMGPVAEISGYWANLNHPTVAVDDTAVANIRFVNGGLGSIVTSVSQKPGIYTKVHIHGENGASVGVQTDTGATFVAGMTEVADPPYNDVWTIPGEEPLRAQWEAEDRAHFAGIDATKYYHALQIEDFLEAVAHERAPAVSAEDGRAVVEMFTAIYRSSNEGSPVRLPVS